MKQSNRPMCLINPYSVDINSTLKISLAILPTVCHTVHMILIQRIWYWINLIFFLYSNHLSAWYCIDTAMTDLDFNMIMELFDDDDV